MLIPAVIPCAPSASRSSTPVIPSFSATLASSIAVSGSELSNSSGLDASKQTSVAADLSAEREFGARSESEVDLRTEPDEVKVASNTSARPTLTSGNLRNLAVKNVLKSDVRPRSRTRSPSPVDAGAAASGGVTPLPSEAPANMAVRILFTAATLAPVAQAVASPTGSTSVTNLGNRWSDPQSDAIGSAAKATAEITEANLAASSASAARGAVAQSAISLPPSPSATFVTAELSISSDQAIARELSTQPRLQSSRSEGADADELSKSQNTSGPSAEPSFLTRPEVISSQPTTVSLDAASSQTTVHGSRMQASSDVPTLSSIQTLTRASFADLPVRNAIDGPVTGNASVSPESLSIPSSSSVADTLLHPIIGTAMSDAQVPTPSANAATAVAPLSALDANSAMIETQALQKTAASFELLARSGTVPSSYEHNQDDATPEPAAAQPSPAAAFLDFPAVDVPRAGSLVSFPGSDSVAGTASGADSGPGAGPLRNLQIQPFLRPRGSAPAAAGAVRQERDEGRGPIPTPVIPQFRNTGVTIELLKDASSFEGKSYPISSVTVGESDSWTVPATNDVTVDISNARATDASPVEGSVPRGSFKIGNFAVDSSSTPATGSSINQLDKKSPPMVSPTVTLGNIVGSNLPSSGGAAAATVLPATGGKDAPAALPAPPASMAAPQTVSAGAPELPKSHQMLDSPTATTPSHVTSSGSGPATDAEMSGQMHVGIRTDAFGTVEIHTVVEHSQIGLTVHGDRDIARWFTSEVPGLEAGLNKSHLNLTGVDFQSSAQSSAGFQQGQSRQSFSQPQNSSLRNAGEALPEEKTVLKSVDADILPSDVVHGTSRSHVSIHI